MNTQDGYDWPTPHAVPPGSCERLTATDLQSMDAEARAFYRQHFADIEEAALLLSPQHAKCITCGDTRVLRMPTFLPSFKPCPDCNA